MMNGIDVSKWQGVIDWNKVKASGVDFVIIRAGFGQTVDPKFETNYKGATSAGLHVGAYWYSYAMSESAARKEAIACIKALRGKSFAMPIYFDVEERDQLAKSAAFVSGLITAFCKEIENAGYFAGFYMSRSPLQTKTTAEVRERFTIWAAEYNTRLNYSGTVGMWQKSSKGRISGISGNVDLDECYIYYPKIIKNGGFNGFSKGETAKNVSLDETHEITDDAAVKATLDDKAMSMRPYTIKKGDTLSAIAKKYGTTVSELVKVNGIKDKNKIYAGQIIKIP